VLSPYDIKCLSTKSTAYRCAISQELFWLF